MLSLCCLHSKISLPYFLFLVEEECVILLCVFQLLLSLCVSLLHHRCCYYFCPALKHKENSIASGLFLEFLVTLQSSIVPCITTLLLPYPFLSF